MSTTVFSPCPTKTSRENSSDAATGQPALTQRRAWSQKYDQTLFRIRRMINDDGREEITRENCRLATCQGSIRRAISRQAEVQPHRQRGMSIVSRGTATEAARREYDFKNPPSRVVQTTSDILKLTAGSGDLSQAGGRCPMRERPCHLSTRTRVKYGQTNQTNNAHRPGCRENAESKGPRGDLRALIARYRGGPAGRATVVL